MALPKPSTPVYELTIPSTGTKVKYRPFLVKDEKALLLANQSQNSQVMIDTLKETIKNCVLSKIDVDALALFDIEYIFCKLRAKSVGEIIDLNLTCTSCEKNTQYSLDISQIEIEKDKDHKKKFVLFDKVGISMKYPSYDLVGKLKEVSQDTDSMDLIFAIIIECVDFIYNDEEIFHKAETPYEEMLEFLNNLTKDQLEKITKFFDTVPKLKKTIEFSCPHCRADNKIVIEGLNNFFQ